MNFLSEVKGLKEGMDNVSEGFKKTRRQTRELAAQYEAMQVAVAQDWAKLAKREGAEYTDAELSDAFTLASSAARPLARPPGTAGAPSPCPPRRPTRTAAASSTGRSLRGRSRRSRRSRR
jgi:hypothetical protein